MKPDTFEQIFQRTRAQEERRAHIALVLWIIGTFSVVIVPDNYSHKIFGVVGAWLVLLLIGSHFHPKAAFNRAWRRAARELNVQINNQ